MAKLDPAWSKQDLYFNAAVKTGSFKIIDYFMKERAFSLAGKSLATFWDFPELAQVARASFMKITLLLGGSSSSHSSTFLLFVACLYSY